MDAEVLKWLIGFGLIANAFPVLINIKKSIEMALCVPHFIFYSPTYIHLLVIYAFSRIDDLSWGTKGKKLKLIKNKH